MDDDDFLDPIDFDDDKEKSITNKKIADDKQKEEEDLNEKYDYLDDYKSTDPEIDEWVKEYKESVRRWKLTEDERIELDNE